MIGINIWDDFYEDGYVPEGKIQETYIYVEKRGFSNEEKKTILEQIMRCIETDALLDSKTQTELFFFDTKVKYPNLSTDNDHLHFTRWEIKLKNITHQQIDFLVEELNKAELKFKEEQLEFYSES